MDVVIVCPFASFIFEIFQRISVKFDTEWDTL